MRVHLLGSSDSSYSDPYKSRQCTPGALPECPNKRDYWIAWDWDLNEPIYPPCRLLSCPVCVRTRAWKRGLAIAAARPTHFLTVTQVADVDDPHPASTARNNINAFHRRIRVQLGIRLAYADTVERGPKSGMLHAHANVRGVPTGVTAREFTSIARTLGMGQVDLRPSERGHPHYSMKGFTDFGPEAADEALRLNGGWLTHHSRDFFGGPIKVVESSAVRAHYTSNNGSSR